MTDAPVVVFPLGKTVRGAAPTNATITATTQKADLGTINVDTHRNVAEQGVETTAVTVKKDATVRLAGTAGTTGVPA